MNEVLLTASFSRYLHPGANDLAVVVGIGEGTAGLGESHVAPVLRIRTPQLTRLVDLRTLEPRESAGGERAEQVSPQLTSYQLDGLGGFDGGGYRFLLRFEFGAQDPGETMRVARIEVTGGEDPAVLAEQNVVVEWTDDPRLIVGIDREVARWTGQDQLAAAVADALDALEDADADSAVGALVHAAKLAAEAGDESRRFRLDELVYQARHSSKTQVSSRIPDGSARAGEGEVR